jgi:VWFA-related protein
MKESVLAFTLTFAMLINAFGQQQRQAAPASPAQPTSHSEPAPSPTPSAPAASLPTPNRPTEDEPDVVRITTNLVQLDATVTDRDGKQVTDLKAEDFEILENGKSQPITNFSYINTVPPAAPPATASNSPATLAPAVKDRAPTTAIKIGQVGQLRPEQVHRALALVVDDLRMSAEGIAMTRQALRKYVDEQTQPGDLVAIIRTSGGMGALQQFTTDREQLHAAIERIRQIARSGARASAFTSVNMLDRIESQVTEGLAVDTESSADRRRREGSIAGASQSSLGGVNRVRVEGIDEFRDTLFAVGTLGALNFVVRGLRDLPGRKAVVLFSDGISIFSSDSSSGDRNERVLQALRQLVDRANRASVVFYAIDTRGLQPEWSASDDTTGGALVDDPGGKSSSLTGVGSIGADLVGNQVLGSRSAEMFEGQNGLSFLARNTGGLAVFNNNDLNRGIRKALDDITGYYLIGYRPDESTFDPSSGNRRFNTWTIRVKNRPNLKVRTRSGFLNVEDQVRDKKRTPGEEFMAALLSPFSARGIDLQLTSFFMNDATLGSTMRSVILMDAGKLTFTKQPDGKQQTVLNILAVTLGDSGQVIDKVAMVEKISVSPENLERFQREGMVYGLNIPISKPGAYLLRIAVRDAVSGRIGSASQFIEVPDVNKDRLTLSSVVIAGNNPEGTGGAKPKTTADLIKDLLARNAAASSAASATASPAPSTPTSPASSTSSTSSGTPSIVAGGEGLIGTEDPAASPASRRFKTRMFLNYACVIYNAKNDKAQRTQFTSQVRLFHDGQEVFVGRPEPLDMRGQKDLTRLVVARRVYLGTILTPGDYVLHLTVTEPVASGSPRAATRYIDFKLVD